MSPSPSPSHSPAKTKGVVAGVKQMAFTELMGGVAMQHDKAKKCRNNSDRPEHRSRRLDAALRSGLLPPGFARPVFHTDAL